MNQTVTIVCITVIACASIYVNPGAAENIIVAAIAGLTGYLSGESK